MLVCIYIKIIDKELVPIWIIHAFLGSNLFLNCQVWFFAKKLSGQSKRQHLKEEMVKLGVAVLVFQRKWSISPAWTDSDEIQLSDAPPFPQVFQNMPKPYMKKLKRKLMNKDS